MKKSAAPFLILIMLLFPVIVSAQKTGNSTAVGDFDGDQKTDFSIFRPESGIWYISTQSGNNIFRHFGLSGDVPVPEDFDGDRKADFAVWRGGIFYVLRSLDNVFYGFQFGIEFDDPTVCRDYDGDGKSDFAVYRRGRGSTFNSFWYIWQSSDSSVRVIQLGNAVFVPAPGDYDGDGKYDPTVFYSAVPKGVATFFLVLQSSLNSVKTVGWGTSGDISVPGDYDGDRITDFAIWRPREFFPSGESLDGLFYVLSSKGGVIFSQWGKFGDRLVPGDYDGDRITDFAVWRPDDGFFYILPKSGPIIYRKWGLPADIPTANYQVH